MWIIVEDKKSEKSNIKRLTRLFGRDTLLVRTTKEVQMAVVDCFIMVFCALGFWYAVETLLMTIEKD